MAEIAADQVGIRDQYLIETRLAQASGDARPAAPFTLTSSRMRQ
jgi:hypothetical protein